MKCDAVIVRYGEVALKRQRARSRYERELQHNIETRLSHHGVVYERIERDWGRLFIITNEERAAAEAASVFGVVSASPSAMCAPELDELAGLVSSVGAEQLESGMSFAIKTRRTGVHPFSSRDVAVVCGDAVRERVDGVHVDLDNPDIEILAEVRQDAAYVYTDVAKGVGGLPLGTQGKLVGMISGGIDSSVACWLMMRRGCELVALYIDPFPYTDRDARDGAMDAVGALSRWALGHPIKVYEVPMSGIIDKIIEDGSHGMTCVLCRRAMYRVAIAVMQLEKAQGIITGSSLGQVASQTATNMASEVYGLGVPLYHPLIGMDKTESVALARRIGTYSISTRAVGECSAVPRYPRTSVSADELAKAERKIELEKLVEGCIQRASVHTCSHSQ